MHKITIVALGPGPREYLTLGALEALQKAQTIVLRTQQHDAANWLKEQDIPFESLDRLHDEAADFDALNQACARCLRCGGASSGCQRKGPSNP